MTMTQIILIVVVVALVAVVLAARGGGPRITTIETHHDKADGPEDGDHA